MRASALAKLERRRFTAEEYLLIEREAQYKSEFYQGEILARPGNIVHARVSPSAITALARALMPLGCLVVSSDLRV
ncbi:MAG: hypothetical protein U0Q16_34770 [Bryobacteraceae bacterium]